MYRRSIVAGLAAALIWMPMSVVPAAAQELSQVERQVRRELITLPFYSVFDNIRFQVDGSKLILSGKVTRPTLKRGAERSVRNIEAIREVDNQIEVLPVSSNDDRIRIATYRAIYYHPMMTRYAVLAVPPIHIIVENGDISLEGVVSTEAEKNLAGIQASGVNGAFSVTNNLQVVRD